MLSRKNASHYTVFFSSSSMMIFLSRWYMNDTTSKRTPRQKKAAIFPAMGIFLMSKRNNFTSVMVNKSNDMIRRGLNFFRMPNHIKTKEHRPHKMGSPVLL